MASLEAPLTVISTLSSPPSPSPASSSSSTTPSSTSPSKEETFQAPAATWYDESHAHFLALLERDDEEKKKKEKEVVEWNEDGSKKITRNLSFGSFVELGMEDKGGGGGGGGGIGGNRGKKGGWGGWGGGGGGRGGGGGGAEKQKLTDVIYFQTLQVPNSNNPSSFPNNNNNSNNTNPTSSPLSSPSIFETKRVTEEEEEQRRILPSSPLLPVVLPYKLANMTIRTKAPPQDSKAKATNKNNNNNDTSTLKTKRRVPILAKISLDGTLIALQYTPTMVRIVRIEKTPSSSTSTTTTTTTTTTQSNKIDISTKKAAAAAAQMHIDVLNQKQWTVDVSSSDAYPVATNIKTIPSSSSSSSSAKQRGKNNNERVEPVYPTFDPNISSSDIHSLPNKQSNIPPPKPLIPTQTQILPGGVLWSDHGGNSQDLILITTTSVIMYKISLVRNNMAKVRMYGHYMASHFWFEPMRRCLVVGSYAKFSYELWNHYQKRRREAAAAGGNSSSVGGVGKKKKGEDEDTTRTIGNDNNTQKKSAKPPERVLMMNTYFLRFPPNYKSSSNKNLGGTINNPNINSGAGAGNHITTTDQMDGLLHPSSSAGGATANAGGNGPGGILFPRLELPPPERLPMFVVGLSRGEELPFPYYNDDDDDDDYSEEEEEEKEGGEQTQKNAASSSSSETTYTATVAPDEIALVNLYGKVFCVEMGCFGNGRGIRLHPLEKKSSAAGSGGAGGGSSNFGGDLIGCMTRIPETFRIKRPEAGSNFISVLDNVLGIHCKNDRTSFFLDIKDATATNSNTTTTGGGGGGGGLIEQEEGKESNEEELLFDGTVVVSEGELIEGGSTALSHSGGSSRESIFSDCFFFLPPCFLLNSQGRGQLYQMTLDLSAIIAAIPRSACPVPFLLRRGLSHQISHSLAVERLYDLLGDMDDVPIQSWTGAIADAYSEQREDVSQWDDEASIPLVFRAALLPSSTLIHQESGKVFNPFEHAPICSNPPRSCRSVLTQTEILERALLPQASLALASSDIERLQFLADISLDFLSELEGRCIDPCPALECLVIALLWRLGDALDVFAFLQSRQVKKAMVQKMARIEISALGTGGGNAPTKAAAAAMAASVKSASVGSEVFAEMLLMIATGVELGAGVGKVRDGSGGVLALSGIPEWESNVNLKQLLITYAVDILCSTSSHQAATRYLLAMGQIMDAIAVCSKLVVQSLYNTPRPEGASVPSHGTRAEDFFRVAVECAKKMPCVSDRARLFQHLHTFLKQWDRECFRMESHFTDYDSSYQKRSSIGGSSNTETVKRRGSLRVRRSSLGAQASTRRLFSSNDDEEEVCSRLAFNCRPFPDDLFGGKGSSACVLLRQMFGYDVKE